VAGEGDAGDEGDEDDTDAGAADVGVPLSVVSPVQAMIALTTTRPIPNQARFVMRTSDLRFNSHAHCERMHARSAFRESGCRFLATKKVESAASDRRSPAKPICYHFAIA
jgi:hypothetical protein